MQFGNFMEDLMWIYGGSAVLATLFLYLRQPIILAYLMIGVLIGPHGWGAIENAKHLEAISHFGIILLLFLIGMSMHPNRLWVVFKQAVPVVVQTSITFAIAGTALIYAWGFPWQDSLVIGAACMFSSTVLAFKLLPTTDLHRRHNGEMIAAVLLIQDVVAISLILFMQSRIGPSSTHFLITILAGILIAVGANLATRYVLVPLMRRYDVIPDYLFLLTLAWCLVISWVSNYFGLSYELGAFIAGVSIATSPVATILTEKMKLLREFFLVIFFFALGADLHWDQAGGVFVPAMLLCLMIVWGKPRIFKWAFRNHQENRASSFEMGLRLGQGSEFALILSLYAIKAGWLTPETTTLLHFAVIGSFVINTYQVTRVCASPISPSNRKRRD